MCSKQSIFFLDWDNTLFSTDYLAKTQANDDFIQIDQSAQDQLLLCENQISILISTLENLGEVFIVTNATTDWIVTCMEICYPSLWNDHIEYLKNRIISAREWFQDTHPGNPLKWKSEAFSFLLKEHKQFDSVFSIGDSNFEREALFKVMKKEYPMKHAKSIKFLINSSITQIYRQLRLINMNLLRLHVRDSDIDLLMKESKIAKFRRV